ncbi:MAG: hypothetical protein QXN95_04050 [Candidatus Bathyarchaeia archaeon]
MDPFGFVHVCQGISIGNTWQKPFSKIIEEYNPYENAVLEPLIRGGPVALVEKFGLPHNEVYAEACHLCYAMRLLQRDKYQKFWLQTRCMENSNNVNLKLFRRFPLIIASTKVITGSWNLRG